MRNSMRPTMEVTVSESTAGTTVTTRYVTSLAAKAILTVWFGAALLASITAVVSIVFHHAGLQILPMVLFPLMGVFVVAIMRVFARMDEKRLEDFVRSRVETAMPLESNESGRRVSRSALRALNHLD